MIMMIMITMIVITTLMTMMMMMQVREDEEVKAQLIQRIDNLTADNDCLKSEMDLVSNRLKQMAKKQKWQRVTFWSDFVCRF